MRPGPLQLIGWRRRGAVRLAALLGAAITVATEAPAQELSPVTLAGVDACHDATGLTAIAGCSDAIADPALGDWDRAILLERRADFYRRRHEYIAALADYDRALGLMPGKPSLYIGRGETLGEAPADIVGADGLKRARADFTRALEIRPGDPTALARRGHTRALLGDLDGAVADLEAALAAPDVAAVLASPGFLAQARENYAFALNARAWERLAAGAAAAALADADRATGILTDEPSFADARAHILAANGRAADAVAEHRRALALGGDAWAARYRAALSAKGFPPSDGEAGLIAALAACAEADCRPLSEAR